MPLYSDSGNYYYSGGSSQLYSPYYSSGLSSPSSSSSSGAGSYTSSYNRSYPGSYMVPILPSPRSPSYTSGSGSSSSCGASSLLGLSSRYQPKLTTITESSGLTGRHSGHSSLMPLTRIQSPKYSAVSSYGSSSSSNNSRYIPARPIAINTADIDVSSARYRRSAEPSVERKKEPEQQPEQQPDEQQQPVEQQQKKKSEQQQQQQQTEQQQPRRSTIRRNRAVVRLSTIRRRSKDRTEQNQQQQQQQQQLQQEQQPEHQFRDLPPAAEPSLSWRQKLAEELAAFPTTSNKKSPGELLRERFYIRDEKQLLMEARQQQKLQLQQQQQEPLQQPKQAVLQHASATAAAETAASKDEEQEEQEEDQEETEIAQETIRRLSLVQCPTFHDICEDISSDKIDDDLNAGELRRRASIIQEQEQELLNKLQKSESGSFQLIHLERRSSHDSTTADESQSSAAVKQPKKKSKKLRHKITAIVEVENALTPHMPSVLELNEDSTPTGAVGAPIPSPKPKFTVNVDTVEEHHQIHKIFKLPKKKVVPKEDQTLPEGFMKAAPKAKTSPLKKQTQLKEQQEEQRQEQQKKEVQQQVQQLQKQEQKPQEQQQQVEPQKEKQQLLKQQQPVELEQQLLEQKLPAEKQQQHVSVAQIFTFDDATIQAAAAPKATPPVIKTEGVATPKPIRKAIQKSESGEDFWSQIGSRETLYMSNRKKIHGERQLEATSEAGELSPTATVATKEAEQARATPTVAATAVAQAKTTATTPTPATPTLKSAIVFELKAPATPTTPTTTIAVAPAAKSSAIPKLNTAAPEAVARTKPTAILSKSEPATPITTTTTQKVSPKSTPATPKLTAVTTTTTTKLTTITSSAKPSAPATAAQISSPKSTPATPMPAATKTTVPTVATTTATIVSSPNSTPATPTTTAINAKLLTAKPAATVAAAAAGTTATSVKEQSGNAINSTVVMTTEVTTIAQTTGKSKLIETIATTAAKTTAAPKINTGQTAKSPEQQQATAAAATTAAAAAATKLNKTTHNNERQQQQPQQQQQKQQQPPDNATAATKTTKQQTETKSKLTEIVEPKSKVQSPKTTKPKSAGKTATPTATAAKKKVTATAAEAPATTPTASATAATITTATTTVPDSNVTPINADQFITLAPTKAAKALPAAATNASSPATATAAAPATATAIAVASTTATTPTTAATITIATTADEPAHQLRSVAAAAAAAAAVDDNSNSNSNSCGEGVGNNLSKFATVSNLAQYLRDVDADLEDYIPSSAENSDYSDDSDNSTGDYSSADGCANLSASMKKKQRKEKKKQKAKDAAAKGHFDPQKKIKIDTTSKCYVKEEAPRYPLVATPRPLWKREKIVYSDENTDDESSEEGSEATNGSLEEETDEDDSDACSSSSGSEEYDDEGHATSNTAASKQQQQQQQTNATCNLAPPTSNATSTTSTSTSLSASASASSSPSIIRMSTCSNDSGFEGGTAPSSPKKMLECDVNCHKKCERLTANLCGVNQKLIVEALNHVKRGARETRDSPSTPPSSNPAYKIEANDEHDETSYTYSQFQKSGRFTAPATVIPRFKNYSVDDFHFLAVLGKGSFGKVLLAELRDTTYYYAIKCLKKDVVLEDDDVDSTLIERKVLALGTKHPYLCHLFCTFQTESHLFFVMEYLNGGDLMFHIQESGRFSEERARFYGAEIISGLKFLHKKGIIYRDLKLDNVLLDYEGHVRIADFGMCKLQIYLDKTADSFCGTPDYMAPEIIKGEKYNQNVDWWSFGVLLYEMLIGQSPFSGCDEDELFWSICNEIPWFPVYISAEATGILKGLLEKDYTKRIGSQYSPAGDIADHIFFRPIDWNLLEKRQIEPPFKPQVKHPLDTQYFDRVFTRERVRLTPIDKEILASMDQKQFHGFTYTNPHITLD